MMNKRTHPIFHTITTHSKLSLVLWFSNFNNKLQTQIYDQNYRF